MEQIDTILNLIEASGTIAMLVIAVRWLERDREKERDRGDKLTDEYIDYLKSKDGGD